MTKLVTHSTPFSPFILERRGSGRDFIKKKIVGIRLYIEGRADCRLEARRLFSNSPAENYRFLTPFLEHAILSDILMIFPTAHNRFSISLSRFILIHRFEPDAIACLAGNRPWEMGS